MEYKVGEKVRIVSSRVGNYWNSAGEMDRWLGKVMTVRDNSSNYYRMAEDQSQDGGWQWYPWMIEGRVTPTTLSPINIFKRE